MCTNVSSKKLTFLISVSIKDSTFNNSLAVITFTVYVASELFDAHNAFEIATIYNSILASQVAVLVNNETTIRTTQEMMLWVAADVCIICTPNSTIEPTSLSIYFATERARSCNQMSSDIGTVGIHLTSFINTERCSKWITRITDVYTPIWRSTINRTRI